MISQVTLHKGILWIPSPEVHKRASSTTTVSVCNAQKMSSQIFYQAEYSWFSVTHNQQVYKIGILKKFNFSPILEGTQNPTWALLEWLESVNRKQTSFPSSLISRNQPKLKGKRAHSWRCPLSSWAQITLDSQRSSKLRESQMRGSTCSSLCLASALSSAKYGLDKQ